MNHTPSDLADFLKKHVRPYDPATDDYERPPFAADIKEGKNDPIYNAHSYHTKVPPRSIIPYILHYTKPGDVVLDLFCGSGMTGVAAQMCANPPADILESFPELKERVGPRACILNDLSPAACHIAYNYNTPVDAEALKQEFERIKTAVKEEFDWLYGTEHYEPAAGVYEISNPDVANRLKNPPGNKSKHALFDESERTWELISQAEVEARLGYPVTELPRDDKWGELDVAKAKQWLCIPATIQYTIWSDVYRCEGFLNIEEPTGKVSTRGKNAGKPIMSKKRVARGCGHEIVLWDAAVNPVNEEVSEYFKCPHCGQDWQKLFLELSTSVPISSDYEFRNIRGKTKRLRRKTTIQERGKLGSIQELSSSFNFDLDPKRELMTMGPNKRGVKRFSDFYTPRNFKSLNVLRESIGKTTDERTQKALVFAFTSIITYCCRKQNYGGGGGGMSGTLYIPSFHQEKNVWEVFERKMDKLFESLPSVGRGGECIVISNDARSLPIPDGTIDYIFVDPPFGGNIFYADGSLLWEGWLGQFTDETKEMVFNRQRFQDEHFKTLEDYAVGMRFTFSEMFRVLKSGRWCTVEFNNSDGAVFDVIKRAVTAAGFEISNMLLLDKTQKSFKQVKGATAGEDVVDKDVLFNLHKPAVVRAEVRAEDHDLEQQLADAVRQHLQSLPDRMKAEPAKYNDEHRTTSTINSMLMNSLIPRGVSVERLNLPFIERVCGRYFRKIGLRWYLRGEVIGASGWLGEEIKVEDEFSAVAWLRQQIAGGPKLIGELKPLWMRATGLLASSVASGLSLDRLLGENFWRDSATNRWREPTAEEREKMNDDRSLRVLHDAERLISGSLGRTVGNAEVCQWIRVLFETCKELEDGVEGALAAHLGFDRVEGYRLIVQLSNRLTPDGVEPKTLSDARKQAAVAGRRLAESPDAAPAPVARAGKAKKDEGPTLFDLTS
jgi:hypothetical protein